MSIQDKTVIKISPQKGAIHIEWKMEIFINKKSSGGKLSCYVPGLEIYYSAKDDDTVALKAKVLTKFFFDHYLLDSRNKTIGYKRLMLDLNRKGFKDNKHHADVMFKTLKGIPVKATMSSPDRDVPIGYEPSKSVISELVA